MSITNSNKSSQEPHGSNLSVEQLNAIDILVQAAPEIDEAIERPGVDLLSPLWIEGDLDFGLQTTEKWVEFSAWMLEQGLLGSDVDASKAFTNRFVEGAQ